MELTFIRMKISVVFGCRSARDPLLPTSATMGGDLLLVCLVADARGRWHEAGPSMPGMATQTVPPIFQEVLGTSPLPDPPTWASAGGSAELGYASCAAAVAIAVVDGWSFGQGGGSSPQAACMARWLRAKHRGVRGPFGFLEHHFLCFAV